MIDSQVLEFLSNLSDNNNKEWFQSHKDEYQEARSKFINFTDNIIKEIGTFDSKVNGITSRNCMFRINRDIRFSNNKQPYKNNFGASIKRGGKKSAFAGYYIHIEPGNSFIGGGYYRPSGDILKKVRQEIDYNADQFLSIINEKDFKKVYGNISGEKLTNPPKGYSKDNPNIDLLKFKSFVALHNYSDKQLIKNNIIQDISKKLSVLSPFIKFLNANIED